MTPFHELDTDPTFGVRPDKEFEWNRVVQTRQRILNPEKTYFKDGVLCWVANDAVLPDWVFKECGLIIRIII